jgi:hypothetical protein
MSWHPRAQSIRGLAALLAKVQAQRGVAAVDEAARARIEQLLGLTMHQPTVEVRVPNNNPSPCTLTFSASCVPGNCLPGGPDQRFSMAVTPGEPWRAICERFKSRVAHGLLVNVDHQLFRFLYFGSRFYPFDEPDASKSWDSARYGLENNDRIAVLFQVPGIPLSIPTQYVRSNPALELIQAHREHVSVEGLLDDYYFDHSTEVGLASFQYICSCIANSALSDLQVLGICNNRSIQVLVRTLAGKCTTLRSLYIHQMVLDEAGCDEIISLLGCIHLSNLRIQCWSPMFENNPRRLPAEQMVGLQKAVSEASTDLSVAFEFGRYKDNVKISKVAMGQVAVLYGYKHEDMVAKLKDVASVQCLDVESGETETVLKVKRPLDGVGGGGSSSGGGGDSGGGSALKQLVGQQQQLKKVKLEKKAAEEEKKEAEEDKHEEGMYSAQYMDKQQSAIDRLKGLLAANGVDAAAIANAAELN